MSASAKEELRKEIQQRLKKIEPVVRFEASLSAAHFLRELPEWQNGKMILLYAAMPSELDTGPLLEAAWNEGKGVCLPVVEGENLEARYVTTLNHLKKGKMGFAEPDREHCPVIELKQIDLIIVPGLAFDRKGRRLGRGGGYYDRFLHSPNRKAPAIGLFFACQEVEVVPANEDDAKLDLVITEKEVIRISLNS